MSERSASVRLVDAAKERKSRSKRARPLVSICVPVYNEESNVERLVSRLQAVASKETGYDFEFIFTDNASRDATFATLASMSIGEPRIRVLRFSRNFGFQKSILTNYLNAKGDVAVQLDADLQDPPELICQFLRMWENGHMVVYGIRRSRKESLVINSLRRLYYWLVSTVSDIELPRDAGDFRLIDRKVLEELKSVREQTPYLRGLIASFGYPQAGIPYDRDARAYGASKFRFFDLVSLGIDGLTSQSTKPLRLITLFGVLISFFTLVAILYYFLLYFIAPERLPSGFTSLVLLVLGSIGVNSFFLGVIGEYVGRTFNNTRGLPISIISDRIEPSSEVQQNARSVKLSSKRR